MKFIYFTFLFAIIGITFTSCGPDVFPAEDCFISYTLEDIEYSSENIEFYNGLEGENLVIKHSFENDGRITMIANDWEPAIGLVNDVDFIVYGTSSNLYFLSPGTIEITELKSNYFSGTFTDGDGFIQNGTFTLRYSEL